jgi:hypothetical protein
MAREKKPRGSDAKLARLHAMRGLRGPRIQVPGLGEVVAGTEDSSFWPERRFGLTPLLYSVY